jgi:putative oxidoreductase
MHIVVLIARILLGLIFFVFGLNGFLFFMPAPPLSGDIGNMMSAMFHSHYLWMTSGAQVICGVLLLINRYMHFAIVVLAGIIINILTLHLTMFPQGFPPAILVLILWFIVAWPQRAEFAKFFAA